MFVLHSFLQFCTICTSLQYSSYSNNVRISGRQYSNTSRAVDRIYNLSISHVDPHMSVIADHISRNRFFIADTFSGSPHLSGCTRKIYTKMLIHRLHKSGTVCTICQARASPYIRISDKLTGIINNRLSGSGLFLCFFLRLLTLFLLFITCFFGFLSKSCFLFFF